MVDYMDALKRPFSDIGKLVLTIVISLIPIVNFMFQGYLLNVAENSMKRRKELPEWKELGALFVQGILAIVINIIYMLPVIIAVSFLVFSGLFVLPGLSLFMPLMLLKALLGIGLVYVLGLVILVIIFSYLAVAAVLRYAEKREFSEAFNLNAIMKKAFTSDFFVGWFVTAIISFVITIVLGLIPIVGMLVSIAVVGIFNMTAMGQVYNEA